MSLEFPVDYRPALAAIEAAQRECSTDRAIVAVDVVPMVRFDTDRLVVSVELTTWRQTPPCPPPAGGRRYTREDDR